MRNWEQYTYTNTHRCTHICMYIHTHIYIVYVCMYMYVRICIWQKGSEVLVLVIPFCRHLPWKHRGTNRWGKSMASKIEDWLSIVFHPLDWLNRTALKNKCWERRRPFSLLEKWKDSHSYENFQQPIKLYPSKLKLGWFLSLSSKKLYVFLKEKKKKNFSFSSPFCFLNK